MKIKFLFLVVASVFVCWYSCKKKETASEPTTTPLEFTSFTIYPDTTNPGGTATVTATAKGDNVNYQWSTSHAELFGYGSTVVMGAAPCCIGTNTVFCTVSDGKNNISKQVTIQVVYQ